MRTKKRSLPNCNLTASSSKRSNRSPLKEVFDPNLNIKIKPVSTPESPPLLSEEQPEDLSTGPPLQLESKIDTQDSPASPINHSTGQENIPSLMVSNHPSLRAEDMANPPHQPSSSSEALPLKGSRCTAHLLYKVPQMPVRRMSKTTGLLTRTGAMKIKVPGRTKDLLRCASLIFENLPKNNEASSGGFDPKDPFWKPLEWLTCERGLAFLDHSTKTWKCQGCMTQHHSSYIPYSLHCLGLSAKLESPFCMLCRTYPFKTSNPANCRSCLQGFYLHRQEILDESFIGVNDNLLPR